MLGGFVSGLTGAGVGALWDGGHCSCEHMSRNRRVSCKNSAPVGGIRRARVLVSL